MRKGGGSSRLVGVSKRGDTIGMNNPHLLARLNVGE
jgi:hypothetical protein